MEAADPNNVLGPYADVPVTLMARLDQRNFSIRQLMEIEPGSVLRMNRDLGEHIEILVDGTLIGFGEVIVSDNSVGVRVTKWHTSIR